MRQHKRPGKRRAKKPRSQHRRKQLRRTGKKVRSESKKKISRRQKPKKVLRRRVVRRRPPRRPSPARPSPWVPLETFRRRLYQEYEINRKRSDEFLPWLEWAYTGRSFEGGALWLWKTRSFPPSERTDFMTISVWYVVEDTEEEEFYLWVYRAKVRLPDFEELANTTLPYVVDKIEDHIAAFTGRSRDFELVDIVAWTATPSDDWMSRETARRRRYLAYQKDRALARARGERIRFTAWSKKPGRKIDDYLRKPKGWGK